MLNPPNERLSFTGPPAVTVNDLILDEVSNEDLQLAKRGISEAFQEVENEIITRSDPQRKEKDNLHSEAKNSQKPIEISVITIPKDKNLGDINTVSPRFKKWFDSPRLHKIPFRIVQNPWWQMIGGLLPLIWFVSATFLIVRFEGGMNGRSILGILIVSAVCILLGWKLLGFFTESRKYVIQQKIDNYTNGHNNFVIK